MSDGFIRYTEDTNGETYTLSPNDTVEYTQTGDWDDTKTGVFFGYFGDDRRPFIKLIGFVSAVKSVS